MSTHSDLKKAIVAAVGLELRACGFVRKKGVFVSSIFGEVYGWVGLNCASHGSAVRWSVNPVVGVHNRTLETLVDDLAEKDRARQWFATVGRPVGYLMPKHSYVTFDFEVGSDPQLRAKEIARNISTYGVPWMNQLADLENLSQAVREHCVGEVISYLVPCIELLLGSVDKALQVAREYRRVWQGGGEHEAAYEKFIERVANWEG